MLSRTPPIYVVAPGRVYRTDELDATHTPGLPPGRGPGRRPRASPWRTCAARSTTSPGRCSAPDARHPLAAALLPVHRAVGGVRRLVPRAPRRPALGRVGRLRHGQPAGAASPAASTRRSTPGSRSAWASSATLHVPLTASATCATSSRATSGSPARSGVRAVEHGTVIESCEFCRWLARVRRRSRADLPVEDLDTRLRPTSGIEVEAIVDRPEHGHRAAGRRRVLEIEELTGFKKPIRFCQVDVGAPTAPASRRRSSAARATSPSATRSWSILPGARAARRLRDRRAQDVRPHLRRHDLLGARAGRRRRPRRHPRAAGRRRDVPPPGDDAAARWSGSTTSSSSWTITPDRGYACACAASPGSWRTRPRRAVRATRARSPAPGVVRRAGVARSTVADPVGCDRFSARDGRGSTRPRRRPGGCAAGCTQAGIRSISLAVDVTNYVMLELGQPMHAFDRDAVTGPLIVRLAPRRARS